MLRDNINPFNIPDKLSGRYIDILKVSFVQSLTTVNISNDSRSNNETVNFGLWLNKVKKFECKSQNLGVSENNRFVGRDNYKRFLRNCLEISLQFDAQQTAFGFTYRIWHFAISCFLFLIIYLSILTDKYYFWSNILDKFINVY